MDVSEPDFILWIKNEKADIKNHLQINKDIIKENEEFNDFSPDVLRLFVKIFELFGE